MGNYQQKKQIQIQKYGGFSKQEIDNIQNIFDKVSNNQGLLIKQKLNEIYCGSNINEMENIFKFLDVDDTQEVDFYKFICQLSLIRQQNPKNKAKIIFEIYDFLNSDNNFFMDKDELKTLLMSMNNTNIKLGLMSNHDEDDIDLLVDNYFSKYDQNCSDQLEFQQFYCVFEQESIILSFLENCGLMTREDQSEMKEEMGEVDQDLENEVNMKNQDTNEQDSKRKDGIEHNVLPGGFAEEKVQKGDQFMAVKPWLGTVKNSVPSDYQLDRNGSKQPDQQLDLEYVYGIRCDDTRNNLRYNLHNHIVYHTAAVGVVMDTLANTQNHYMEHNDDIISMDVYDNLIVTGQIGHKPLLTVWDSSTNQTLVIIKGDLEKGINQVCFDRTGNWVAAASMDEQHNIFVYDIQKVKTSRLQQTGQTQTKVATGRGPSSDILQMLFSQDNSQLICCCTKEVYFLEIDLKLSQLKGRKGLINTFPLTPNLTGVIFNSHLVTGTISGFIYIWAGSNLQQAKNAHLKGVTSMFVNLKDNQKLITAGNDGNIIIWNQKFAQTKTITLTSYTNLNLQNIIIRSVCINQNQDILISTRGSEIVEFKNNVAPTVLMRGHYTNELWGLTVHPTKNIFYTVGEEGMLAIWDSKTRKQIKNVNIKIPSKCISISYDGRFLAVGCKNGELKIFDDNLNETKSIRYKKEISVVKFSPNSEWLCVGIAPPVSQVYSLSVKEGFKQKGVMQGNPSRIINLDFSQDSKQVQLNNSSYELLYYDSESGKQNTSGASYNKNEKWASWSLIIGWPVQGIFPPASDGSDVNSVDRSSKMDVLVTGDDFGKVKLFKYPCVQEKSSFNKYGGHSAHVTNVKFLRDSSYVISTGGGDKSIFQWRYVDSLLQEEDQGEDQGEEDKIEQEDKIEEEEEEEGDQMMAIKPFIGQVKASTPSEYQPSKKDNTMPTGNLHLKHVFGYCCFDGYKNTAKLVSADSMVMASAGLGVVMNFNTLDQSFFNEHNEDVVSMALHPNNKIVATGQKAAQGQAKCIDLFIWELETKKVLANLNSFHLREVQLLQFSPDGTKLLSIGKDDDNSLAIWDWQNKALVSTSPVDKQGVSCIAWASNTEFMTSGPKHIKFWKINGRNVSSQRGKFIEVSTIANYYKALCVMGTITGNLILYQAGNPLAQPIKAHQGQVTSIQQKDDKLLTGGSDGIINIFNYLNNKLTSESKIDIKSFTSLNPTIITMDYKFSKFLVGTSGGDILISENTANLSNFKIVHQGHGDGEVWGLCVSPNSDKFISCGGDKSVRLWDAIKYRQLAVNSKLTNDARAIDWSKNGEIIVVADVKGVLHLLDCKTLSVICSYQSIFKVDPKKRGDPWIEDLKLSPNSQMAALGAHGGNFNIEVVSVSNSSIKAYKTINGRISSALLHLDWSSDSQFLIVNSQAYELMFYSVESKAMVNASSMKDTQWSTWTCILGFPVQGIMQGPEGFDIHGVYRSNSNKYLATGDIATINLFQYPVVVPKQLHKSYRAHSSHITDVQFSYNDNFLFSTGGYDKCCMIWATDFNQNINTNNQNNNQKSIQQQQKQQKEQNENEDDQIVQGQDDVVQQKQYQFSKHQKQDQGQGEEDDIFESTEDAGDEFMAVKPWLGAIKQPSDFVNNNNFNKVPKSSLQLDYVYGYRAKDCRNNVFQMRNGNLVYNAAALGVVLDIKSNTQQFFNSHTDDITAIDMSSDGVTMATGEVGAKPAIYIWNGESLNILQSYKGVIQKGVSNLAFSPSGSVLVASAIDDDHYIAVLQVKTNMVQSTFKSGRDVIVCVNMKSDSQFVTVGVKHYKFWEATKGNSVFSGVKANSVLNLTLTSIIFNDLNGDSVVGASDGQLMIFKQSAHLKSLQAHTLSIDSLFQSESRIYSGGKDGLIIVWSQNYTQTFKVDLHSLDSSLLDSTVRSIFVNNNDWFVGCYSGEIFALTENNNNLKINNKLMSSHYTPNKQWTNEVWGLAVIKDTDNFLTCSDDGTLRLWSRAKRQLLKMVTTKLDSQMQTIKEDPKTKDLQDQVKGRCVDVNEINGQIAVGFKDGTVRIYDPDLNQLKCFKVSPEWISDLRYSPDGSKLAVASHDNAIYIYSTNLFNKLFKLNKHSSYITHLDWSQNGSYLHTNCGAYELLFWDVQAGKQLPGGATMLRDEEWHSWTCVLGWPVQGIYPLASDGTDINYVDRTHVKHPDGYYLMATGDDFSGVNLQIYPSLIKNSPKKTFKGHCSHVPCVKFSSDDKYLFSVGGEDNCVFQWKLIL